MNDHKQKDFYVDLNSIFDTRFGVVERMKPGHARQLIKDGLWHKRTSDFIPDIDREEFLKIYRASEMETLENSIITNVFHILNLQIKEYLAETMVYEVHPDNRPRLYVNTYPYDYPEDIVEELKALVYIRMNRMIEVKIVNTPIKELTPALCRQRFFLMFMYDYVDWINTHSDELMDVLNKVPRIDDLIIIGPILFFEKNPDTDQETLDWLAQGINPLGLFERGLGVRIGVRLVDPDVFCVMYPDDRILQRELVNDDSFLTMEEYANIVLAQTKNSGVNPEGA